MTDSNSQEGGKFRFAKTYCSQCGGEFGPGDEGYSHCSDHRAIDNAAIVGPPSHEWLRLKQPEAYQRWCAGTLTASEVDWMAGWDACRAAASDVPASGEAQQNEGA